MGRVILQPATVWQYDNVIVFLAMRAVVFRIIFKCSGFFY